MDFRQIRTSLGLSLCDFARLVRCAPSSIERVERGEILESPELVSQLCERLAVYGLAPMQPAKPEARRQEMNAREQCGL